ncbi:MAG: hypothetical protein ACRDNG_08245, partial [Gaiellaceae bacterium]
MEFDELQPLRRAGANEGEEASSGAEPVYPPGADISTNPIAQLVADLIETTGLLPLDRLAGARSRAGAGSLAQAIMDERLTASAELLVPGARTGAASASDEARELAERHHLP